MLQHTSFAKLRHIPHSGSCTKIDKCSLITRLKKTEVNCDLLFYHSAFKHVYVLFDYILCTLFYTPLVKGNCSFTSKWASFKLAGTLLRHFSDPSLYNPNEYLLHCSAMLPFYWSRTHPISEYVMMLS